MGSAGSFIDMIVPETALKNDLWAYSGRIFLLSLLISALSGAFISWVLYRLVVCPMMKITEAVIEFSDAPEKLVPINADGSIEEIGRAQIALNNMQETVSRSFRQQRRLAELGEAVAKITHDLRNSLSVARLASEGLQRSEDPRVKSAAPRLERAIERAINIAETTLSFGKAEPVSVRLQSFHLRDTVDEAILEALVTMPEIDWLNDVDEDAKVLADPEMLHRICANLVRNSGQAISQQSETVSDGFIKVEAIDGENFVDLIIEDNGPGIPEAIQSRLFQSFSTADKPTGTGLGLSITKELALAMGGDVSLDHTGADGTQFRLKLRKQ
jgi:signal transduction histidine kinase